MQLWAKGTQIGFEMDEEWVYKQTDISVFIIVEMADTDHSGMKDGGCIYLISVISG